MKKKLTPNDAKRVEASPAPAELLRAMRPRGKRVKVPLAKRLGMMSPDLAELFVEKYLARKEIDYKAAMVQRGEEQRPLKVELEDLEQQYSTDLQIWPRIPKVLNPWREGLVANHEMVTAVRGFVESIMAERRWPIGSLHDFDYKFDMPEFYRLLTAFEAVLQKEVKLLHDGELTPGRYRITRHNADKWPLRNYLVQLAKVWHEIAGATPPMHRKRFVYAIAAPVVARYDKDKVGLSITQVRDYLKKYFKDEKMTT